MDDQLPPLEETAAFIKEIDPTKPLPVDIEALQAIKFESEDPNECARTYKDEGNYHFKKQEYTAARDNYTHGLCCDATDNELITNLLTNRAAAEFKLGNYGRCVSDCKRAMHRSPDNYKAHLRLVQSLLALDKLTECSETCESALLKFTGDQPLLQLSTRITEARAKSTAKQRRAALEKRRTQKREASLERELKRRGIQRLEHSDRIEIPADLSIDLQPDSKQLQLPVLLLYPEFGETDLLQCVQECASVQQIIDTVQMQEASWNVKQVYTEQNVCVFAEQQQQQNSNNSIYRKLNNDESVAHILETGTALTGCVLVLCVLCADSKNFFQQWCSQNKVKI